MELEFYAGFFKQLNFLKIKFQNRSISLNSFNQGAFCWKVSMKKSIWRKSSYRQLNLKNNKIIKKLAWNSSSMQVFSSNSIF